jgi:hypothetical protein
MGRTQGGIKGRRKTARRDPNALAARRLGHPVIPSKALYKRRAKHGSPRRPDEGFSLSGSGGRDAPAAAAPACAPGAQAINPRHPA